MENSSTATAKTSSVLNITNNIANKKLLTFDTVNLIKSVGEEELLDKNGMFLAAIKPRFTKVKVFLRGDKLITLWVSALADNWGNDKYASATDISTGIDSTGFQRTAEEERSIKENYDRLFVSKSSTNESRKKETELQTILNRIVDTFEVE